MPLNAEEKIQKFVRRCVQPKSGYTRLSLVQIMASGGGSILRNIEIEASQYGLDESKISEIAAELMSTAQEDADGHISVTTYCVKAFKGVTLGEKSPNFRLRSNETDDEALGDTEGPTMQGALAQTQRHLEVVMRSFVQQQEVHAQSQNATIARLTQMVTHYEDKHFDHIMALEEMANEKNQREIASHREMAKEKRIDDALKTFKPLVPVLMAKFKGTPAEAKPGLYLETLKEVLKQVTPEEMTKLAEILGPKSLALATIYMDAHKEEDTPDEQPSEKGPDH